MATNYRGTWAFCLLLAMVGLVLTYCIFGFYYEEYEALFDGMLSGKFSPGSHFDNWYYMGHIGLGTVYAKLYCLYNGIEWMSVLEYGYLWLSAGLICYLLFHYLAARIPRWTLVILYAALFVLCILGNTMLLQYTRVACLVCASALLAIVVIFGNINDIKQRPLLFAALMLFFCLGTFTRLEASLGVTALVFFFALAVVHRNIWYTIGLFVLPATVCMCLFGWIMLDSKHSADFYKQIEPDVESQLTARGNVAVPVMHNAKDSLRYEAAMGMLWSDPSVISNSYLRSLIGNKQVPVFNQPQWARTIDVLKELIPQYWLLAVLNLLMVLALLLRRHQRHTLWWLLYNVAFWMLILAQTYFVKIEGRAYFPFLCVYTLGNVLLWSQHGKWELRIWLIPALTTVCLAASVQLVFVVKDTQLAQTERSLHQANMNTLKQYAGGKILLLNSVSYRSFMMSYRPLVPFDASAFYRVYLNEVQVMPLIHPYKEFLDSECHCDVNDFSNLFRYLQHQDKEVFMLTTASRADLVKRYLLSIHGLNIDLKEVDGARLLPVYDHEHNGTIQLKLYRLGK